MHEHLYGKLPYRHWSLSRTSPDTDSRVMTRQRSDHFLMNCAMGSPITLRKQFVRKYFGLSIFVPRHHLLTGGIINLSISQSSSQDPVFINKTPVCSNQFFYFLVCYAICIMLTKRHDCLTSSQVIDPSSLPLHPFSFQQARIRKCGGSVRKPSRDGQDGPAGVIGKPNRDGCQ